MPASCESIISWRRFRMCVNSELSVFVVAPVVVVVVMLSSTLPLREADEAFEETDMFSTWMFFDLLRSVCSSCVGIFHHTLCMQKRRRGDGEDVRIHTHTRTQTHAIQTANKCNRRERDRDADDDWSWSNCNLMFKLCACNMMRAKRPQIVLWYLLRIFFRF